MAQIIKHRRGSLEKLGEPGNYESVTKGELVITTGSSVLTTTNGSSILFAGAIDSQKPQAVNRVMIGSGNPATFASADIGQMISGVPYYASGSSTLYLLGVTNTAINLVGNIQPLSTSVDSRLSSLEAGGGVSVLSSRVSNLEIVSASLNSFTQSFSASVATSFSASAANTAVNLTSYSASAANSLSASEASTSTTINSTITTLSSSVNSRLNAVESETAALESFTSSINTTIKTRLSVEGVISGSSQLTSSYDSRYVGVTGTQTINGTKTFDNIVVIGTGSFAYIESVSGSAKIIGDAFIVLNSDTPAARYAGIQIWDSGSIPSTASFFFDGVTNDWGYEYSSSTGIDYAVAIFGPEFTTKGSPTYLTANRIPKATDNHHLNDSNITDSGTLITLGSNTTVTGTLVATDTTLVSGSSQISYTGIANIPAGIISSSAQLPVGIVSGSTQITISSTTGYTEFSSSISTSIFTLSSSIDTRLDTLEGTGAIQGVGTTNSVSFTAVTASINLGSTAGNTKRIAFRNTDGLLDLVATGSVSGDLLQWDGSNFVMSNMIDGGAF